MITLKEISIIYNTLTIQVDDKSEELTKPSFVKKANETYYTFNVGIKNNLLESRIENDQQLGGVDGYLF